MAGPDHPAVHRGRGDLGGDRRPDHGKPGPPPARLGPVDAGRLQERHRRGRPGRGGRVPRLGHRAHVLRRHSQRRGRGGDHGREPRHARDPARRPDRPELRGQPHRQGAGPDRGRRPAAPAHGGRQPRQQRQGPPPPAAGRGGHRRAGGSGGARPDRRHAGELPARGQAGAWPPGHAHLRPERDRRLHGPRHHRRRTARPGRHRPFPPHVLISRTSVGSPQGGLGERFPPGSGGSRGSSPRGYTGTAGSLAIASSMRSCGRSKSTISPVRYFS